MYVLIQAGKKKQYKYWAVLESSGALIVCYGSLNDPEITLNKVNDMKAQEAYPKRIDPHKDMLKRVRKKFDEGYETASSEVEKVIKMELNRRYGGTLFSPEPTAENRQEDNSAPRENKSKKKEWKPSEDFTWF